VTHNPRDDKQVWVRTYEEHSGYTIVISDNGSGLTEEKKDVLFDMERRIAGVGLHQVRHIIEKYKGRIEVSVRLEGKPSAGAEFRVWLPSIN
jgi:signal transduction histidine kinase